MALVTCVTLESVSYHLPDGSSLFSDIDLHLDQRRTGLVGRNGVGKSILAQLIAGDIFSSTGRCIRNGTVHYLVQQISPDPEQTVASLAGVQPILAALERIEQGSSAQADFDCVGDRWAIRQQLHDQLGHNNLSHLAPSTPASSLSGGEAMRVALMGAFMSEADLLILDEPTNHLDRQHRMALHGQLERWPNGLMVVSHDRDLLELMERILELSSLGLTGYGGGYSFYTQARAQQGEAAQHQLALARLERKRQKHVLREQRESLERRQSRGNKQASEANQAKILLGRQKERSQASSSKLRMQQDAARERLDTQVRLAADRVEEQQAIFVHPPQDCLSTPMQIAELINARLPQGAEHLRSIDLTLARGQRVALLGPNGCGKSTLLRVLAGQLPVVSGRAHTFVSTAYLDQKLGILAADRSVLDQLQSLNRQLNEGQLRTRLAQLGLNADQVCLPCGQLSGGERLKAAMACVFYGESAPQLLLLDEPANHLDVPSILALQHMLNQYTGTLVLTSHDEMFLAAIGITHRLQASPTGWLNTAV